MRERRMRSIAPWRGGWRVSIAGTVTPTFVMRSNHLILGLGLGLFAVLLFGASLPATRLAVRALDPLFVATMRAAGSGTAAAIVLLATRRPIPWTELPRIAPITLCIIFGFPGLMSYAMTMVPSAHGGVILGLLPVTTAIAAVFVAGERPSPFFFLMSALGAALVIAFSLDADGAWLPVPGDVLLIVAVAMAGTGYAFSGELSRRMPGWEVISWAAVLSLPVSIPLALVLWPRDVGLDAWPSWAGLAYAALVAQYLSFWFFNTALALGGVARIGQLQLLQPFATLVVAALLLGETIDLRMILFATAVVAVVALGLRARVGAHRHQGGAALARASETEGG